MIFAIAPEMAGIFPMKGGKPRPRCFPHEGTKGTKDLRFALLWFPLAEAQKRRGFLRAVLTASRGS